MGKKQFCFFQTAESGNQTPNSGVKGSGANHYPRAPATDAPKYPDVHVIIDRPPGRWVKKYVGWSLDGGRIGFVIELPPPPRDIFLL